MNLFFFEIVNIKFQNSNRQLENAVLMLKYSHFIRKVYIFYCILISTQIIIKIFQVFDDQDVSIDGTVNGPKLLMELYQTLGNELTYLSQEDKIILQPFQQVN